MFAGNFGEIWEKKLSTPETLPAPTLIKRNNARPTICTAVNYLLMKPFPCFKFIYKSIVYLIK